MGLVYIAFQQDESLEYAIVNKTVSQIIRDGYQQEAHNGLQQADGGRKFILQVKQTCTIDPGVNNITCRIDERVVQIEDLVKARIKHITQAEYRKQYGCRADPGQSDMPETSPASCAIDVGSFVQCRVDPGKRGKIDNGAKTEFLPDVTTDNEERKQLGVGKEQFRLESEQGSQLIDGSVIGEQIEYNAPRITQDKKWGR